MLTLVDNIVIVVAVLAVLAIGFYFSRTATDMESYYLANRSLPWSLVVGTLMASWYGGNGVIGTVGYASTFGLASWFLWSVGAHAVRFPLALWVGPRIHIRSDVTISDVMQSTYGKWPAVISACILFFYCSRLGEISAIGVMGEAAWGADKFLVAVIVVVLTILLTCLGGLMGVAVTDMIFFFFMVMSVCLVFPTLFDQSGGMLAIREAFATRAEFADIRNIMHPIGGMPVPTAIMLILLCLNVYADPAFYQRFSASNTVKTGRRALLTCFSIWLAFDIVIMMSAIIVRLSNPENAELAYIQMILSNLPIGFRALFVIGIFGAVISTLDSYYLVGGASFAKDILGRVMKKQMSDKQMVFMTRVGASVLGILGVTLAFRFKLIYDSIVFITSVWMSAGFVPVLMALLYKGKKTPAAGMLSLVMGIASFVFFGLFPITIPESFGGTLDPILIALPISFVFWLIGNTIGKDINADNNKIQA